MATCMEPTSQSAAERQPCHDRQTFEVANEACQAVILSMKKTTLKNIGLAMLACTLPVRRASTATGYVRIQPSQSSQS
jgi:hypothetical protein